MCDNGTAWTSDSEHSIISCAPAPKRKSTVNARSGLLPPGGGEDNGHVMSCRRTLLGFALCALALAGVARAAKEFRPPAPAAAGTYPARDEHPQERITIAVDPFDTREKAAVFSTDWRRNGYLPVRLIVTNGGGQTVALNRMKVELITASRSRLEPATDEDLYRRLSRTRHRGDEGSPMPIPFPRRTPNVGVSKDVRQEVDAAQFRAVAVEPRSTQSGFLFFDIEGVREPLAGARLYVSGVRDADGQEVMFFEIPLNKYLQAGR